MSHPSNKGLGRGEGNGHGKTCGRGHKGQKSRSGGSIRVGFEGGQMPLYRKLPRRGFNNFNFRNRVQSVNVGELARLEGTEVNRDTLVAAGLIRDNKDGVKLLGDGEVEKAFTVSMDSAASAKAKIEAAGGSIVETPPQRMLRKSPLKNLQKAAQLILRSMRIPQLHDQESLQCFLRLPTPKDPRASSAYIFYSGFAFYCPRWRKHTAPRFDPGPIRTF